MVFHLDGDDPEFERVIPIEITDSEGDNIEIAFDIGEDRRVYLGFDKALLAKAEKAVYGEP